MIVFEWSKTNRLQRPCAEIHLWVYLSAIYHRNFGALADSQTVATSTTKSQVPPILRSKTAYGIAPGYNQIPSELSLRSVSTSFPVIPKNSHFSVLTDTVPFPHLANPVLLRQAVSLLPLSASPSALCGPAVMQWNVAGSAIKRRCSMAKKTGQTAWLALEMGARGAGTSDNNVCPAHHVTAAAQGGSGADTGLFLPLITDSCLLSHYFVCFSLIETWKVFMLWRITYQGGFTDWLFVR